VAKEKHVESGVVFDDVDEEYKEKSNLKRK